MTELDLAAAQEQSTPHGGERGSLARFGIALSAVGISVAALVASGSANAGSEKPTTSGDPDCFPIPGGASGDTAVLNLTQTDATSSGWGAIRPSDEINMTQRSDPSSHVNFDGSDSANPNTALSEIGLDGRVCLDSFVGENGRVNNIVDLVAVIDGDSMRDIKPQRLLDNREGLMISDDTATVGPDTYGVEYIEGSGYGEFPAVEDFELFCELRTDAFVSQHFSGIFRNLFPRDAVNVEFVDSEGVAAADFFEVADFFGVASSRGRSNFVFNNDTDLNDIQGIVTVTVDRKEDLTSLEPAEVIGGAKYTYYDTCS